MHACVIAWYGRGGSVPGTAGSTCMRHAYMYSMGHRDVFGLWCCVSSHVLERSWELLLLNGAVCIGAASAGPCDNRGERERIYASPERRLHSCRA